MSAIRRAVEWILRRRGVIPIGVATVLVFLQVAAAAVIATTWGGDTKGVEFPATVNGRSSSYPLAVTDKMRWLLWQPGRGLPFNAALLDPERLTLWVVGRQATGGDRLPRAAYDANDLKDRAAKLEETMTWSGWMRWVYRVSGSDLIGFVMLTLSYSMAVACGLEYWRLGRYFGRLERFWDQHIPDPANPGGATAPRRHWVTRTVVPPRDPWHYADTYYWNQVGLPENNDAMEGHDLKVLPHKILEAALQARKLYHDPTHFELAHQAFRQRAVQIMDEYENRLAEVQYFAQTIAPLGFIGTVLHLGLAMGHAQSLSEGGGLGPVASSLGMAFDTTFVALVAWIAVEYLAMRERSRRLRVRDEAEALATLAVLTPPPAGAGQKP